MIMATDDAYVYISFMGRSTSYSKLYGWTPKTAWKSFYRTLRVYREI